MPQARDDFRKMGNIRLIVDAWDVRRARLTSQDCCEKLGQAFFTDLRCVTRTKVR